MNTPGISSRLGSGAKTVLSIFFALVFYLISAQAAYAVQMITVWTDPEPASQYQNADTITVTGNWQLQGGDTGIIEVEVDINSTNTTIQTVDSDNTPTGASSPGIFSLSFPASIIGPGSHRIRLKTIYGSGGNNTVEFYNWRDMSIAAIPGPAIRFDPEPPYVFSYVPVGSDDTLSFTIENTGSSIMSGTVSSSNPAFTCLSVDGNPSCSYSLLPGSEPKTVVMQFSPAAAVVYMGTLTFPLGDGNNGQASVVGQGVSNPNAQVHVESNDTGYTAVIVDEPGSGTFSFDVPLSGDMTNIGTSETVQFVVTNMGGDTLLGEVGGLSSPFSCSGTSGIAYDLSGKGNDATIRDNPSVAAGKYGQALEFNYDRYEAVVATDNFLLSGGTGKSVSISAWAYLYDDDTYPQVIAAKHNDSGGVDYGIGFSNGGLNSRSFFFYYENEDRDDFCISETVRPLPNRWYFVTATFDGATNNCKMYVDGVLSGSAASANGGLVDTDAPFTVGAEYDAGHTDYNNLFDYVFDGRIDEVRVHNKVLSPGEVANLYNNVNVTSGLVGYWSFDTAGGIGGTPGACPYAIGPLGSANIDITFAPTAGGLFSTPLLFGNSTTGGGATVTVNGTGNAEPILAVTPTEPPSPSTDFGNVGVGASRTFTAAYTVQNIGAGSFTVSASFGGASPGMFSGSGCAGELSAGQSCLYSITYTPTSDGTHTATVTFTGSPVAPATMVLQNNQVRNLIGNGVPLLITAMPPIVNNVYDFGDVLVNTAVSASFTITNTSATDTISGDLTFSAATPFICTSGCSYTISPGGIQTVTIQFFPTATVSYSETVTFSNSVNPSQNSVITLRGRGVAAGISVSPPGYVFPDTVVGAQSAAQTFTITHAGTGGSLADISISIPAPFVRTGGTCASPTFSLLAPGNSCTVIIRFEPSAAGEVTDEAAVTVTSPALTARVGLGGRGVVSSADLIYLDVGVCDWHDFGVVDVGSSADCSQWIYNNGSANLSGGNIAFDDGLPFSCTSGCPFNINAESSAPVTGTFTPISDVAITSNPKLDHLVLTLDQYGFKRFYINGELHHFEYYGNDLSNWDLTYKLSLGNVYSTGEYREWVGEFYLVAIYPKVLAPGEVLQNYSAGENGGGRVSGPVALYTFDEGGGTSVNDTSGVAPAHDLTIYYSSPSNMEWRGNTALWVNNNRIRNAADASKVIDPIKASGQFTVEAWVKPDSDYTGTYSRIVTLSPQNNAGSYRNMDLIQLDERYVGRIRVLKTTGSSTEIANYQGGYINDILTADYVGWNAKLPGLVNPTYDEYDKNDKWIFWEGVGNVNPVLTADVWDGTAYVPITAGGSVDFGSVNLGDSVVRTIRIRNTGPGLLDGSISFGGAFPSPFSCVSGCSFTGISNGGSVTIDVKFEPGSSHVGVNNRATTFTNTVSGDTLTAQFIGTGVFLPVVSLGTSSFDFGKVRIGTTKDLSITLQNNGADPISGEITFSGADPTYFCVYSAANPTCSNTISYNLAANPAQQSCAAQPSACETITFRFAPDAKRLYRAIVGLSNPSDLSFTLDGEGVTALTNLRFREF